MNKANQEILGAMTLEEFREWYKISKNADSLPVFANSMWLSEQLDPVKDTYTSMKKWVEKYPYPK